MSHNEEGSSRDTIEGNLKKKWEMPEGNSRSKHEKGQC